MTGPHTYHQYTIAVDFAQAGCSRDQIKNYLEQDGI